ncbi:hypothetical protein, partial [Sphaerisporangium rufum]|uniref:hypothetical protein n=1 Tax=Sphaerisporangium rufum TaxID=1381558 RepID=UPI00194DD6A5
AAGSPGERGPIPASRDEQDGAEALTVDDLLSGPLQVQQGQLMGGREPAPKENAVRRNAVDLSHRKATRKFPTG